MALLICKLRVDDTRNAPINVMPQYPPYGQNTGHTRGTDEKSVPLIGDFDIQVYMHVHMKLHVQVGHTHIAG